ncbi:magnesium transporter [Nisaea acidiphila]|uniref:Magnesium transporter n=1 Tax=Nisaea acidiphila TaxID=1862145 RepID=A0A9J7AXN1_9PROT|nr:magnesium transporter [Nisaea acidiphila]UUX51193.1 magnesium transporter [Nisaea acidiphila]
MLDPDGRPVGKFKPRQLLLSPPDSPLSEIMEPDPVVVSADLDQEEVARLSHGRDHKSFPVVDAAGKLIGQITHKKLDQIMREEAAEDLLFMSGVSGDARTTDSVARIVRGRLPWLLAGLIGATFAALVIGSFEESLQQAAILAAFIPVVMSVAGNSGLQASAVSVQALASGTLWPGDVFWRFLRELGGALANGAAVGTVLAVLVILAGPAVGLQAPVQLAAAVAFSLLTVTTIAALVGALVPIALDRAGIDPAAATGVFITTGNDVLGVFVFFVMAELFYF